MSSLRELKQIVLTFYNLEFKTMIPHTLLSNFSAVWFGQQSKLWWLENVAFTIWSPSVKLLWLGTEENGRICYGQARGVYLKRSGIYAWNTLKSLVNFLNCANVNMFNGWIDEYQELTLFTQSFFQNSRSVYWQADHFWFSPCLSPALMHECSFVYSVLFWPLWV